jgi:uncharacterized protein YwqG
VLEARAQDSDAMTHEELQSLLATGPLSKKRDAILALAAPCVRLSTNRARLESLSLGQSRLGGAPDVPEDLAWPHWNGEPQSFIGQFNLGDVPSIPGLPLPSDGALLFFYTARQDTWGFDPKDRGSFGVTYVSSGRPLRRPNQVPDVPNEGRFQCCSVTFHEDLSLPPWESQPIERLGLNDAEQDAYFELLEESVGLAHQLGGYPDQVQGDMTAELELVTNGLYTGDASGWADPRAKDLKEGRDTWQLLFQAASDEEAGMMWGDVGYVYYWIKRDALDARAFDQAWMILQCS